MRLPTKFKAKSMRSGIPVALHWRDASTNRGWNRFEEMIDEEPPNILTLGFLMRADATTVLVAPSVSEYNVFLEPLTIPRDWVITVTRLPRRLCICQIHS